MIGKVFLFTLVVACAFALPNRDKLKREIERAIDDVLAVSMFTRRIITDIQGTADLNRQMVGIQMKENLKTRFQEEVKVMDELYRIAEELTNIANENSLPETVGQCIAESRDETLSYIQGTGNKYVFALDSEQSRTFKIIESEETNAELQGDFISGFVAIAPKQLNQARTVESVYRTLNEILSRSFIPIDTHLGRNRENIEKSFRNFFSQSTVIIQENINAINDLKSDGISEMQECFGEDKTVLAASAVNVNA